MARRKELLPRNRIVACPECLGKLEADRNAVTSGERFIYRARHCPHCGATVHTKQAPEEITWIALSA
jgi:hypothetical protein